MLQIVHGGHVQGGNSAHAENERLGAVGHIKACKFVRVGEKHGTVDLIDRCVRGNYLSRLGNTAEDPPVDDRKQVQIQQSGKDYWMLRK